MSNAPHLPEEILEHIFSLVLFSDREPSSACAPQTIVQRPTYLLLVCKSFERIAKPLLYTGLHLRSRDQADKLAVTLTARPAFVSYIRAIRVDGPSASRAFHVATQLMIASHPPRLLELLDVKLIDDRSGSVSRKEDLDLFCTTIRQCPDTRRLVVRQSPGFLTHGAVASFVHALAAGVRRWTSLEYVDFRYKPSPLPLLGQPQHDPLAVALASVPNLKVLRAPRPTLLNTFLLDVSENPALERIELLDSSDVPDRSPSMLLAAARQTQCAAPCVCTETAMLQAAAAELATLPQSLFASQAMAHPRLHMLVRAGRLHLILERLSERQRRADVAGCAATNENRHTCDGFESSSVWSIRAGL